MSVKLGVKISGVEERNFLIVQELKKMGLLQDRESVVQYNGKTRNILGCFNRALKSFENTDVTHVLVLQDDADLCDDFLPILQRCCEKFENAVWSLFSSRVKSEDRKTASPYIRIRGYGVYGVGIVFPMKYFQDFMDWQKECVPEGFEHDDVVIGEYCKQNGIDVMSTIPSLLQHLGGKSSMMGHNCGVVSKVWNGAGEPKKQDWDNLDFNTSAYIGTGYCSNLIKKRVQNGKAD